MPKEIWKELPGFNGDYLVSSHGRVKSFKKNNPIILKTAVCKKGYQFVGLCLDGKCKSYKTSRLVALNFLKNPKPELEVNHKDHDKKNNHFSNLEFVNCRENHSHRLSKIKGRKFPPGVWLARSGRFCSRIYDGGEEFHLGTFDTVELAYGAYKNYQKKNKLKNKYLKEAALL